jgi:integrase
VRWAFDKIAADVGIEPSDLYAHRFRHTYATHFLQEMDKDPEALFKLQQQMGWAKLDTAMNYLRRSRREELDQVETKLLSGRKRKKT